MTVYVIGTLDITTGDAAKLSAKPNCVQASLLSWLMLKPSFLSIVEPLAIFCATTIELTPTNIVKTTLKKYFKATIPIYLYQDDHENYPTAKLTLQLLRMQKVKSSSIRIQRKNGVILCFREPGSPSNLPHNFDRTTLA